MLNGQKLLLFFALLLFLENVQAKVRILTFHFNKPNFIELQYKTFKKFSEDDFEMIVFNDANTLEREKGISEMCERYGIQCVRYQPEWHETDPLNPYLEGILKDPEVYSHVGFSRVGNIQVASQASVRHCHVIQYALDHYGYTHDGPVVIMDGDAFFIRPISICALLESKEIHGIKKLVWTECVDYLWVVFIAFDPRRLPDLEDLRFHLDLIGSNVYDSGAHSYHYLKNHPEVRAEKILGYSSTGFRHWEWASLYDWGFNKREGELIKELPWPQCVEFHMTNRVLHFGASAFTLEGHDEKEACMTRFINDILNH